jgi:hypothetical protein
MAVVTGKLILANSAQTLTSLTQSERKPQRRITNFSSLSLAIKNPIEQPE